MVFKSKHIKVKGEFRMVIKIIKDEEFVERILKEIDCILGWFRKYRSGKLRGTVNLKKERRQRIEKGIILFECLEIKKGHALQVLEGRRSLQKVIKKSKSKFLRVGISGFEGARIEGPKMSKARVSSPFGLTKKLPGSFESRK